MTTKPRKEAERAAETLTPQLLDGSMRKTAVKHVAQYIEIIAIRPVADPLAEALDEALAALVHAADYAAANGYETHQATYNGSAAKVRAALAAYREEGK